MREIATRTLKESSAILLLSLALAAVVNALHPRGIRPGTDVVREMRASFPETLASLDSLAEVATPLVIGTAALRQLLASGKAVLLDARNPDAFAKMHIPGAKNLPYELLYERAEVLTGLDPETWVVCYCDGPPCDLAQRLAEELLYSGLRRVAVYGPGLKGWQDAGGEVETGEP